MNVYRMLYKSVAEKESLAIGQWPERDINQEGCLFGFTVILREMKEEVIEDKDTEVI